MFTIIGKRQIYHNLIALATASFFFLNVFTADVLALAPEILLSSKEKSASFQVSCVCNLIEKRAAYGKSISDIYLDDIQLWSRSTESAFSGCSFKIQPDEITIYLPQDNAAIRYYDSNPSKNRTFIPGTDWARTKTEVINERINRQVIFGIKALPVPPYEQQKKPRVQQTEVGLATEIKPLAEHVGKAVIDTSVAKTPQNFDQAGRGEFNILLIWPPVTYRPVRVASIHYLASALTDSGFLALLSKRLTQEHPEEPLWRFLAQRDRDNQPRFNVEVLDLSLADDKFDLAEFVKRKPYQIIGFSSLTDYFSQTKEEVSIVKKASPESAVILGGWHASALPEDTLAETDCDMVVKGYGVEALAEIALRLFFSEKSKPANKTIRELSPLIDGVYYRSDLGAFIKTKDRAILLGYDHSPYPSRSFDKTVFKDAYPEDFATNLANPEGEKVKTAFLNTSFGCPFKCKYCANPAVYKRYIARDMELLRKEMEELYANGARVFSFRDEIWSLDRERTMKLVAIMKEFKDRAEASSEKFNWSCQTRADLLDRDMLTKMKESGLCALFFGIESGDSELVRMVKTSDVDSAKALENIKIADELKIVTFSYLQVGLPGQSFGSIIRSARFLTDSATYNTSIFRTIPYPGTPYFNPNNNGPIRVISSFTDVEKDRKTETDNLTDEEMHMIDKCFKDLIKAKGMKRGFEEACRSTGETKYLNAVIFGDESVIMGTLRMGAIVDLILNSHPNLPGPQRNVILQNLRKTGSNLFKIYDVLLNAKKGPYWQQSPFGFLGETRMDFIRDYDEFLASISFVNGFDILKNATVEDMYVFLFALFGQWQNAGKRRMDVRFDDVSLEEFKSATKMLMEKISGETATADKNGKEKTKELDIICKVRGNTIIIVSNAKDKADSQERINVYNEFFKQNSSVITTMVTNNKKQVVLRVPIEGVEAAGIENVKSYLGAFDLAPNGYVELYYMSGTGDVPQHLYQKYGITKTLPQSFKRTRSNTITLLPVFKGEEIDRATVSLRLGGVDLTPEDTIIAPVGLQNDLAGLVRSTIMGLRLMYLARQKAELGTIDEQFARETLDQYKKIGDAYEVKDFNLTIEDIVNLATGKGMTLINALKKLIRLLPIRPINTEELKQIYEHAKAVIIAA